MNAAYKEAYLHYRESFSSIFNEEHREEQKGIPETAALDDGFSLRSRYYTGTLKWNIFDFEDPFTEPEGINGHELMDRDYDIYDDIEFSDFQNGNIILKAYNTRDEKQENLTYDTEFLKQLLKERFKAVRMEDTR